MIGHFGVPGQSAALNTVENEFLWGGSQNQVEILLTNITVDGTARDAGSAVTTVLRKGLLMGKIAATGKYKEFNPASTDGSQYCVGVLNVELRMVNDVGSNVDRVAPLVVKAPVKAARLLAIGVALVGSASEFVARKHMAAAGFRFDDDLPGIKAGLSTKYETKITDYVVLAADAGTTFLATTAAANFTLPTPVEGMVYEFVRLSDHELVVTSAAAGQMIVGGDLAANSITFTTDGQHVGARVKVTAIRVGADIKWLTEIPPTPYGTGVATLAFALAT